MNPDPNVDTSPATNPAPGQTIQPATAAPEPTEPVPTTPATEPSPATPAAVAAPSTPAPAETVVPNATPATPDPTQDLASTPDPLPTDPAVSTPTPPSPSPKSHKMLLIIVTAVVCLLVLAAGAYLLMHKSASPSADTATKASESKAATAISKAQATQIKTKDLSTLQAITMAVATPAGYTENKTTVTTFHNFTQPVGDSTCELGAGTIPATSLKGTTPKEVADTAVSTYKSEGDTIVGPSSGTAVTFKDATNAKTTYSVQTFNYDVTFKESGAHMSSHYSVAILGNGDRAVVDRSCASKAGIKTDTAELAKLDALAAQITVTVQ